MFVFSSWKSINQTFIRRSKAYILKSKTCICRNISFIYSFQWTVEMNGVWRFSFSSALRLKMGLWAVLLGI